MAVVNALLVVVAFACAAVFLQRGVYYWLMAD